MRNCQCFKALDLIWLMHFTTTDITLSNFRHLLQRACWLMDNAVQSNGLFHTLHTLLLECSLPLCWLKG